MEDIKDTLKKIEEAKKKQEKTERIIILLIGIFVALIFTVIGINIYYSGSDETISEPKVVIEDNKELKSNIVEKVIPKNNTEDTKNDLDQEKVAKAQTTQQKEKAKENVSNQEKETNNKSSQQNTIKEKTEDTSKQQKNTKKQTVKPKLVYTVQVGAFSSKKRAENYLKSLKKQGMIIEEGKIYRVVIGKFKTYKDAAQYMKKYNLKGFVRKIKIN